MDTTQIIASLDKEIAHLTKIRTQLLALGDQPQRGRPKGSVKKTSIKVVVKKRKPLSAEAKARIAAAQKARWAKQKKAAKA